MTSIDHRDTAADTPAGGTPTSTAGRAGPVPVPPEVADALRALAAAAGTDDLAPMLVCAAVLAARLPRAGTSCRVRAVLGGDETIVPDAAAPGPPDGLRSALRRSIRPADAGGADPTDERPVVATISVAPDGRHVEVETASGSSDLPTAQAWASAFLQLMTGAAAAPDTPLRDHPLVGPQERDRILHGLNPYRTPEIGYRTMAGPFEEQVVRAPDAVALLDEEGTTVTYLQLNERANRLAHHLRARGAGPGSRIGICLQRGIHQVVAIYAAVKTGAAYVPVDADLPDERIAWMLDHAQVSHVLSDRICRSRIPYGPWETLDVRSEELWAACPATNPVVGGSPSALVHILYTSGTTGRPKGVASPTAGALANVFWMQQQYPFHGGDTALFKASPGFDISIWELFWPLYQGARLVICRPGAERDPRHLARLTEEHRVSQVFLVPTMMPLFLDSISGERADALRWVVCGGEPMNPRIPGAFRATLPAARLVNAFGPTEAGPVTDNVLDPDTEGVPVGRPADNFRTTVLDTALELVPLGATGEVYISGPVGLADGYWRAPARTAERFVADPYGPPGSRMYRTGDLCRLRDSGALEHLGRIDRQIKIRGLRVEPGEIEAVLAAHPAVGDCAVVPHGQPARLLAFVVPAAGLADADVDPAAVQAHAAMILPVHMRPEQVVPVGSLPATVNSKIDHDALIARWRDAAERQPVVPPADELEARLAGIYSEVLGTSPICMTDNFVQLGGHSMLAIQLLDRCTTTLHAAPDVTELLTGTVRDVAASIRAAG